MAVTVLGRIGSQRAVGGSPKTEWAVKAGTVDVCHKAEEEARSDGGGELHSHAHCGDGHKDLTLETDVEYKEKAYEALSGGGSERVFWDIIVKP